MALQLAKKPQFNGSNIIRAQDWTAPATFNAFSASIAAVTLAELGGGAGKAKVPALYRLFYYVVVVVAATTSSSISISVAYTDTVQAQTVTPAAYTGNAVGGLYTGQVVFQADSGTITLATTYASVGATAMTYKIFAALTKICSLGQLP